MRLQGRTRPRGVKIAIQPYPYVKGESKGQNRSLVVVDADTQEVFEFIKQQILSQEGASVSDTK